MELSQPTRMKALLMLVVTTLFWALSFPIYKALVLKQLSFVPGVSTWFLAAGSLVLRFSVAAIALLLVLRTKLASLTREELGQGIGLGLFAATGLVVQMDGLSYTEASTSAFLTQCYCCWIPAWLAFRRRERPSFLLIFCCVIVMTGVALLARLDFAHFRLGRGEVETLISSVLFMGQILWVERPRYARNRVVNSTFVMFVVIACVLLPLAWATSPSKAEVIVLYSSWFVVALMALLIIFCTIIAYLLMNRWQRFVSAADAGVIYCVEPVFASLFATLVPAWLAAQGGFTYANEALTRELVLGGGLITLANLLLQTRLFGWLAPELKKAA